jgi:uncharacterized membrane protein YukC
MAFDFTKLTGYKPEMTADEKLALLDKYETPPADYTGYIKKDTFDKTASDLAEAKRQLKAKQTEDEQKEAARLEAETAIKTELETLRKENAITKSKAEFLALGYDDTLATDTAKALADGDMPKVFANQKAHIENVKKAERAAALADDPKPPAGNPSAGAIDYGKAIAEAQANSDFGTAAMLLRQQQEATMKITT